DEQKMVALVNQERAKYGLAPLKVNMELVRVARLKAQDMVENNYFSHTSPTYGSPFEMMKQFGISYRTAGENLAGAPSVEVAHQSLMNSSGHRANILNPSFTQVGIGVAEGSVYGKIFVQMFIG
ncbi:MAG: CAP domain-containing protein, partial [Desulfotomaculales bacterium]